MKWDLDLNEIFRLITSCYASIFPPTIHSKPRPLWNPWLLIGPERFSLRWRNFGRCTRISLPPDALWLQLLFSSLRPLITRRKIWFILPRFWVLGPGDCCARFGWDSGSLKALRFDLLCSVHSFIRASLLRLESWERKWPKTAQRRKLWRKKPTDR